MPLSIFRSGRIVGPYRVVEVAKGPKHGQLKNSLSILGKTGNIFVKHFLHIFPFRRSCQKSLSYYLDLVKFLTTTKNYGPTTKFCKLFCGPKTNFLTLNLKSFTSISSSFGKTVKRPINYFSQTSTQMAPLGTSGFWGLKSKKYTFYE